MLMLAVVLLSISPTAAYVPRPTRRTVSIGLGSSLLGLSRPAFASKFPQHVEDLARAATAQDRKAVQAALKVLALPSDEADADVLVKKPGDSKALVTQLQKKVSSTKVAVDLADVDLAAATQSDVRYVYLKNTDTGGLYAVSELKPGDTKKPMFAASLPSAIAPKGTRVTPAILCNKHGIWEGTPFVVE